MKNDDLPQVMPHDRDAEMSLIVSVLQDNSVILDVAAVVSPESFYVPANQLLWSIITDLYLNGGKAVDPVTVWDRVVAQKRQADIGGHGYLKELAEAYANPKHALNHAEIVQGFHVRRQLIRASDQIRQCANDRLVSAQEAAESAEREVFGIIDKQHKSASEPIRVAIGEAEKRIEARKMRTAIDDGITTGYIDLDEILGSMENGAMVVVAARPSVGKTAFALNVLLNVAKRGEHVFMASLEQKRVEIGERLIAMESEIDSYKIRKGYLTDNDLVQIALAEDRLRHLPWELDDTPIQSVIQIAAAARRSVMRNGTKLVLIDYLQLIETDERRAPRHEQVAAMSRRIKIMARDLNVPVMLLCQVNRKSEDRQDNRIKVSDLRESGAIEQDADVVMLLQRAHVSKEPGENGEIPPDPPLEVEVGKNRNGPTGPAMLTFIKENNRIWDKA